MGGGISSKEAEWGFALKPDIISADAGSTDSGPYYLGTGKCKYAREAVKEDMRILMRGAKRLNVPITVGSCGTCGTDSGVEFMATICDEICKEDGLHFKIAKIYMNQCAENLQEAYRTGKIKPLEAAPAITEGTFSECSNIVGVAGAEPFMEALRSGAEIVLCGRASDTAVISAFPIMRGCDVASAWHGAKIAECGALCTTNATSGGVFLTFDENGFVIEPTDPNNTCTVYSVSAHMAYENADPVCLTEPSGRIDTGTSVYSQLDDRRVAVSKTTFLPAARYTMKLEGASLAGYQTVSFVGIRDRRIMKNPMAWVKQMSSYVDSKLRNLNLPQEFTYEIKLYGWNAVSGALIEPGTYAPLEIGLMLTVTAQTQELATKVAKVFNPYLLHFPVRLDELLPSYAFPFSPAEMERGPIYEFRLFHVLELDRPLDAVRIVYETI